MFWVSRSHAVSTKQPIILHKQYCEKMREKSWILNPVPLHSEVRIVSDFQFTVHMKGLLLGVHDLINNRHETIYVLFTGIDYYIAQTILLIRPVSDLSNSTIRLTGITYKLNHPTQENHFMTHTSTL